MKNASQSLSAIFGAIPNVLTPIAADEHVCDRNSADDDNSANDIPYTDHKKMEGVVAGIGNQLESIQLNSSSDKPALEPSSEVSLMKLRKNTFQLFGSFNLKLH